jgi:hypothetical protein
VVDGSPVSLLTDLDGLYTEHQRCGELDGDVDDVMVWLACDCRREHGAAGGLG